MIDYTIEITQRIVSYRIEGPCPYIGTEEGHECTGDCTWLDGDSRELESPTTWRVVADADDLEEHEGSPVAWATEQITQRTDAHESSVWPTPEQLAEHAWLSGSYQDPYQGDSRVTETTVRLTGGWAPEERAQVFRAVVGW